MTNIQNKFIAVDSLKLSIPLSHVQIIDENILSTRTKIVVSDSSGEVLEETKLKELTKELTFENYKIRVAITSRYNFQAQANIDQLEIYLHSKICEYEYLKGLTQETIEKVYNRLMSTNVFFCPFSVFIKGHVNDIDIKQDFNIEKILFKELTKKLELEARPNKQIGKGVKRYSLTGNIQFNRRESSTAYTPFLKIYDKKEEALNSKEDKGEFFRYYLRAIDIEHIKRMECTLKRPEEARTQLGLKENTLQELLNVDQETLKKALTYCLNKNLNKRTKVKLKPRTKSENMTDTLIFTTLSIFIHELNRPYTEALKTICDQFNSKQMKYKVKKRVEEVYKEQFTNDTKAIKLEKLSTLLNEIGWGV
jgi:hypothetical protein